MTLDPGKATANQTLSVVAKNASGTESQPATATTPADVTAPTVDNITGNSGSGYEITGTADPNTTIEFVIQLGQSLVQVPLMRMVILL